MSGLTSSQIRAIEAENLMHNALSISETIYTRLQRGPLSKEDATNILIMLDQWIVSAHDWRSK